MRLHDILFFLCSRDLNLHSLYAVSSCADSSLFKDFSLVFHRYLKAFRLTCPSLVQDFLTSSIIADLGTSDDEKYYNSANFGSLLTRTK